MSDNINEKIRELGYGGRERALFLLGLAARRIETALPEWEREAVVEKSTYYGPHGWSLTYEGALTLLGRLVPLAEETGYLDLLLEASRALRRAGELIKEADPADNFLPLMSGWRRRQ